ncbi:MAG: DUF4878 domain-containing protein [Bacteroidetes bacterium]|nr:DUF4878 domain-containing protein [Bacteroidota bacterium]
MKKINVCLILTGLLLAFLLTSCGGGGGGIISKTPSDVVKTALNNLKAKDYPGVIKYYVRKDGVAFTKEDTQKFTGLCTWATQEYEKKQGLKDIQILEEKISEDGLTATVKYKLQFNNGTDSDDKVNLKKVNGDWFIVIGN